MFRSLTILLIIDACALDNALAPKVEGRGDGDSESGSDTEDSATPVPDTCNATPDWSLDVVWSTRLSLGVPFGGVVVGPLAKGGSPAIVVATPGSGAVAYDGANGDVLWEHSLGYAGEMSAPALGDLDGDGVASRKPGGFCPENLAGGEHAAPGPRRQDDSAS